MLLDLFELGDPEISGNVLAPVTFEFEAKMSDKGRCHVTRLIPGAFVRVR
jgi:hypothetical protein